MLLNMRILDYINFRKTIPCPYQTGSFIDFEKMHAVICRDMHAMIIRRSIWSVPVSLFSTPTFKRHQLIRLLISNLDEETNQSSCWDA
jgi:hypothetical protein